MRLRLTAPFVALASAFLCLPLCGAGLDTAGSAEDVLRTWSGSIPAHDSGRFWLRIRGVGADVSPTETASLLANRAALAQLRAQGYRVVCMIRWGHNAWSGVRSGGGAGNRAPLDLREAFERARRLAEYAGDAVDAWEFDNEPDIAFFADNADVFAAYHKAVALGLAAGRKTALGALGPRASEVFASDPAPPLRPKRDPNRGPKTFPLAAPSTAASAPASAPSPAASLILMGAPGLPPGPHFEQLLANGYLAYTEGFNYHYYGFAMDYAGVYEQFRDAVGDAATGSTPLPTERRSLPVVLTEWGYSLLDGMEADTTAGRVRQWRFFRDTSLENERLRIAAPLAFLLPPYFEHQMKEFGLTMPTDGLAFPPEAFGAHGLEPWMQGIGRPLGAGLHASPALAWMLARAQTTKHRASRAWTVRTEAPSPVVFDFIAGEHTGAKKAYDGYWLKDLAPTEAGLGGTPGATTRSGRGLLVAYNFSPLPADLDWPCAGGIAPLAGGVTVTRASLRLAPGERREIPVTLTTQGDVFTPTAAEIHAEVRIGETRTRARWATRLYPWPDGFIEKQRRDFSFPPAAASRNRERLLARPHAPEEPRLHEDGRWLVTEGARVEETPQGWRLHLDHFPGVGVRPVVAELPLPAGWRLATGDVLAYEYRLSFPPAAVPLRFDDPLPQRRLQTGGVGALAECYLRTTDGKLFSAASRYQPTSDWRRFQQSGETFGMRFLGRTLPPWRFADNEPASLVFFIRPDRLPAVFEVRDLRVVRWEADRPEPLQPPAP